MARIRRPFALCGPRSAPAIGARSALCMALCMARVRRPLLALFGALCWHYLARVRRCLASFAGAVYVARPAPAIGARSAPFGARSAPFGALCWRCVWARSALFGARSALRMAHVRRCLAPFAGAASGCVCRCALGAPTTPGMMLRQALNCLFRFAQSGVKSEAQNRIRIRITRVRRREGGRCRIRAPALLRPADAQPRPSRQQAQTRPANTARFCRCRHCGGTSTACRGCRATAA